MRRRGFRARPGWVRVDGTGSKLAAVWEHPTGWRLQHCGHPTALHPWLLIAPDGRVHKSGAVNGDPDLGRAWDRLDEAMDYAATQIQVGRTRTADPADLADLPLFARGPRVDQPT